MNRPSLKEVEALARAAGKILRDGYEQEHEIKFKGEIDLVTEIDHRSEAFLLGEIRAHWPESRIVAEESGESGGGEELVWYIDPLDGTVNYAHGVPMFCVSIACGWDGQTQLGAVYDPLRDEMFLGERGAGAWLNGRALKVSTQTELKKSLLVTGFPYDAWTTLEDNVRHFARFGKVSQGVRRLGSAALDLCYTAAGRFEAFWELSLQSWDVAAGGLIVEEAGGRVTNLKGQTDYFAPPASIIAAAPGVYEQMFELLNKT